MISLTDEIESGTFEAGRLVKIHGVNGRIVIRLNRPATDIIDFPEWIFLRIDGGLVPFSVSEESVFQKDNHHFVVGLDQIGTPEKASELVGLSCHLEGEWADWFEEGREASGSLVGYEFTDEISGKGGIVTGFENIPGNPLLNIEIDGKNALIPMHAEFVVSKDEKRRQLILRIPEGLLDL